MKWIVTPLLWILALIVGILVAWRIWQGKPIILKGRWSPRFVRMVVFVLVMMGVGNGQESNLTHQVSVDDIKAEATVVDLLPEKVAENVIARWSALQHRASIWSAFKKDIVLAQNAFEKKETQIPFPSGLPELPEKFRTFVISDLDWLKKGQPYTSSVNIGTTMAVLDEMERNGYYDHWLVAYLWRRTPQPDVELFRLFYQHARIANTLIKAKGNKVLYEPRAWMSKAGPSRGYYQRLKETYESSKGIYPFADTGTWEKDGIVLLTIAKGSNPVTLIRNGKRRVIQPQEVIRFGRLDLLETGSVVCELEHSEIGPLELPAGQLTDARSINQYLFELGKYNLRKIIEKALDGDEKAVQIIEEALPLAHKNLRESLQNKANAQEKGAPRLRLILSLFDDVPQEKVPSEHTPIEVQD
jgi:hypothetical protein